MPVPAASEAFLSGGVRPPTAPTGETAPPLGVAALDFRPATRPTAGRRPDIEPVAWPPAIAEGGFATSHPYVRRFWTAAIGPGAVADLLRLAVAAQRGRSLPRPESLTTLVREDLARWVGGRLFVRITVPPLSPALERRLSPDLKRSHRSLADRRFPADGR